jgi:hypothetical protein
VPGGRVGYAGLCLRAALVLRCLGPARTLVGKGKLRRPRLPHVANGELSLWAARHDWAMHLTSNEIAGGSVAVASLAIIGGIYSARMTSRDAVKIAREERSSRRQNEQDVLKRTIYANCLAALMALMLEKRMSPVTRLGSAEDIRATGIKRAEAVTQALNATAEVELIFPKMLFDLASAAFQATLNFSHETSGEFSIRVARLRTAMRPDLNGVVIPAGEELDRIAEIVVPPRRTAEETTI